MASGGCAFYGNGSVVDSLFIVASIVYGILCLVFLFDPCSGYIRIYHECEGRIE